MGSDASDIKTAAGGVKSYSGDQGTAVAHSIESQIAADKYNEATKRTRKGKNPIAGMRMRMRPPGATG